MARRLAAAGLCGLAAWLTVTSVAAGPHGSTRLVLTASTALPVGHRLTEGDLQLRPIPDSAVPEGALGVGQSSVGLLTTGPVAAGEVLTAVRVRPAASLGLLGPDQRAVHLPLADPAAADPLRPGDHIDVLSVRDGRLVAGDVLVLDIDAHADESSTLGIATTGARGLTIAAPATAIGPLTSAALGDSSVAGVHVAVRPIPSRG